MTPLGSLEPRTAARNGSSHGAPSVSVAMATWCGAAYLAEQLASIAAQSRLPDELVVCDDRSTDETAAIVRRFAATAPFEVRLEINDRQLGVADNFSRAVSLCHGDWVLLADQDDVWMPHKVEALLEAVTSRPEIGLAFSDAVLVDEARTPLGDRLWSSLGFSRAEQRQVNAGQALRVLLKRNVVTGATAIFRRAWRDLLFPVAPGWVHDGWFALLIAAVADCVAVPEPLIEYRQHARQQIGARRRSLYQQYLRAKQMGPGRFDAVADSYAAARDRLFLFRDRLRDGRLIEQLEEKVRHFRVRSQIHNSRVWRLPLVVHELAACHYLRYSSGWRSLAQDLLL